MVAASNAFRGWRSGALRAIVAQAVFVPVLRAPTLLVLQIGLAFPLLAEAAQTTVATRTAMILVRALVYDKALAERAGADVSVLVVDGGVGTCGATMTAAFSSLPSTVKGLPLVVGSFSMTDGASLEASIAAHGADAVFICDGIDVATVAPVLVQKRVVGMGASRASVVDGLALGAVVDASGAAKVIVNLPTSRSAGVEFSTELFALAEVIR